MRINVYSQELTSEVKALSKTGTRTVVTGVPCHPNGVPTGQPRQCLSDAHREWWDLSGCPHDLLGIEPPFRDIREVPAVYLAAQLILHSSPMLHHAPEEDDRSAVTFWLPKSKARREEMAKAFERITEIFRTAPEVD